MQPCRIGDLRCREVINVADGRRLGFVDDVLLDVREGRVLAITVQGRAKLLGVVGREEDYVRPWESISRMGDDIILVDVKGEYQRLKRQKSL
jgi:YlmC/YmxH family sporulation protein